MTIELYPEGRSTAKIGSVLGFSAETIRQRLPKLVYKSGSLTIGKAVLASFRCSLHRPREGQRLPVFLIGDVVTPRCFVNTGARRRSFPGSQVNHEGVWTCPMPMLNAWACTDRLILAWSATTASPRS